MDFPVLVQMLNEPMASSLFGRQGLSHDFFFG
jgi:hypothetical protein